MHCADWCVMTEKDGLTRPEKIGILKRLVWKFSASRLTRSEKIDILKRLIRKYSTSRLTKRETIEILKRLVKKYSTNGPVNVSKDLSDEDKK